MWEILWLEIFREESFSYCYLWEICVRNFVVRNFQRRIFFLLLPVPPLNAASSETSSLFLKGAFVFCSPTKWFIFWESWPYVGVSSIASYFIRSQTNFFFFIRIPSKSKFLANKSVEASIVSPNVVIADPVEYFLASYFLICSYKSCLKKFKWRKIALQCSVGFCHTTTQISHIYMYPPSLLNLPP